MLVLQMSGRDAGLRPERETIQLESFPTKTKHSSNQIEGLRMPYFVPHPCTSPAPVEMRRLSAKHEVNCGLSLVMFGRLTTA